MRDPRFIFKYCVRSPFMETHSNSDNLPLGSDCKPLADLGTPTFHESEVHWQVKAPPGSSANLANGTLLTSRTPQGYH